MPISLPGGKPVLTLKLERSQDKLPESFSVSGIQGGGALLISFDPKRKQTLHSAYGEIRLPIIGAANKVHLVQAFEVVIAGRYEHYKGNGTLAKNVCFFSPTGAPRGTANVTDLCDRDALALQRKSASSSRFEPTVSAKWTVSPDFTFRGSYATGYLPPRLNDLIPQGSFLFVSAQDPERGGEQVGGDFFGFLPGVNGGNPNVKPERSTSISFGAIVTPWQIPGLRFSADYTKIKRRGNYFSPEVFLFAFGTADGQRAFEGFLTLFPERFTRSPASDGFAVGPITGIDVSTVNISGTNVEAIDFALDYFRPLWGGTIDFGATATHNLELSSQLFDGARLIDVTGSRPVSDRGILTPFGNVALAWKGVGSLRWSDDRASIGVRARFFDGFDLNYDGVLDENNNALREVADPCRCLRLLPAPQGADAARRGQQRVQ